MRRRHHRWIWLLLACALQVAASEWIDGTVVRVHDGDTATVVTRDGHLLQIRFYGVDAPERASRDWPAQPYAQAAATFVRKLLLDLPVRVRLTGERTYGREVGEVFVAGRSASAAVVGAGLGWWNAKYAREDRTLAALERTARRARRGLWRAEHPEPPWRFRGRHRRPRS